MSHRNQLITGVIITAIIAGSAGFFGGTQYEKNSLSQQGLLRNRDNQFGGRNGQSGQGPGRQFGAMRGGPSGENNDFVVGEIIAKDEKSITIKTRDGGSKIIFFSDSTTVGKSEQGSLSDLNPGQQITANGKNISDGSLAAQNIQIRPQP